MSEEKKIKVNSESSCGGVWIALAILIIFFFGEPDLHSLLIQLLQKMIGG